MCTSSNSRIRASSCRRPSTQTQGKGLRKGTSQVSSRAMVYWWTGPQTGLSRSSEASGPECVSSVTGQFGILVLLALCGLRAKRQATDLEALGPNSLKKDLMFEGNSFLARSFSFSERFVRLLCERNQWKEVGLPGIIASFFCWLFIYVEEKLFTVKRKLRLGAGKLSKM